MKKYSKVGLIAILTLTFIFLCTSCTDGNIDSLGSKVVGISIEQAADKTEYELNESLNLDGLRIKVEKDNDTFEVISPTDEMILGFDSKTAGTKQLFIYLYGFTASYTITVHPEIVISVRSVGKGNGYLQINDEPIVRGREYMLCSSVTAGYEDKWFFWYWQLDGEILSYDQIFIITADKSKTYVAVFTEKTQNKVYIDTFDRGNVVGFGFYNIGDTAELALEDYTGFLGWEAYVHSLEQPSFGSGLFTGYDWKIISFERTLKITVTEAAYFNPVYDVKNRKKKHNFTANGGGTIRITFADGSEYTCTDTLAIYKNEQIDWIAQPIDEEDAYFAGWIHAQTKKSGEISTNTYNIKSPTVRYFGSKNSLDYEDEYTANFTKDESLLFDVVILVEAPTEIKGSESNFYRLSFPARIIRETMLEIEIWFDEKIIYISEFGINSGINRVVFGSNIYANKNKPLLINYYDGKIGLPSFLEDFGNTDEFYIKFDFVK